MMTEHIRRQLKQNGDFKPEATFYLSENGFDFLRAQAAYNADFSYDLGFQESKKDRWLLSVKLTHVIYLSFEILTLV